METYKDNAILRKAQLRMLEILIEIDKICSKYGIDYWLDSGTLLGAVRHGGFIPWDDDVDICVQRKDYKRLRKILITELPKQFVFTDWTTDKYFFDKCARVRDTLSLFDYPDFRKQKYTGLYVDIIILEKMPSMKIKKIIDKTYGTIFRQLNNISFAKDKSSKIYNIRKMGAIILSPIAYFSLACGRCISFFSSSEKLAHTYSGNFYNYRFFEDIFPLSRIKFESYFFKSPKNYDEYLKKLYGDYMKLPPEKERTGHNINIQLIK